MIVYTMTTPDPTVYQAIAAECAEKTHGDAMHAVFSAAAVHQHTGACRVQDLEPAPPIRHLTPAALTPRPFGLFDIPARAQLAAAITLRMTASRYSNPADYPDQELCNRANALARECENGRPTFCYSPHTPDDYRQAALYLTARHERAQTPNDRQIFARALIYCRTE